jgi:hypothetical protein
MTRRSPIPCWLPVLLGLTACGAPPPTVPPPGAARPVRELARWRAIDGGREVAVVLQLQIEDPSGPVLLYRILDANGRWLGHANAQLRFTRRMPFREEEQDLGVWALPRGVALLAGVESVALEAITPEAGAIPRR